MSYHGGSIGSFGGKVWGPKIVFLVGGVMAQQFSSVNQMCPRGESLTCVSPAVNVENCQKFANSLAQDGHEKSS